MVKKQIFSANRNRDFGRTIGILSSLFDGGTFGIGTVFLQI
jgi:hypothetical protein